MELVVEPLLHRYDAPPVAVKVVDEPAQILLIPDTETVGNGLTEMLIAEVPAHPEPPVCVAV